MHMNTTKARKAGNCDRNEGKDVKQQNSFTMYNKQYTVYH